MSRCRILFFPDGRRVEVDPDYVPPPRKTFHIINGSMDPTRSMADGKMYTDRRKMEREQQARGFEVVQDVDRPLFDPVPFEGTDWSEAIKRTCDEMGVD